MTTLFLYFAYGSNMLTERLRGRKRCPSARPVGMAVANDYRLYYFKESKDGSGKATLVKCRGERAYGVLFKVSDKECAALDKAEDCGKGYDRIDDFEVFRDAEKINARTYLATKQALDTTLTPYDWYRALVLAGAIQHGLPDSYIETLCKTAWKSDAAACRPSRLAALHVLETAGFGFLVREG